jgi:plastocyanin
LAVQAGQEITVLNSDGVLHNINARPKNNEGFNIGQPVKGMETKKSFANAEVMIPIKCDVHPWMGGYIGVQTHPYSAVSDETGSFSLKDLPPGTYEIEAWHEVYGTTTQSVTIGPKENKTITFTFKGA